jgi:hypothetical protein
MKKISLTWAAGALALALASAACGGGSGKSAAKAGATPNPADFQARVTNPFFPLTAGTTRVYEGEELDPDTDEKIKVRIEWTVLSQTEKIAGVETTVVQVKDFEAGELTEDTKDYYAQNKDGAVYNLGERVDEYEDGKVVGHGGQWLTGGDNQAGILMPADPKVGSEFETAKAPDVAEGQAKVVAVEQTVKTPAGTFSGCIKIEEFDPIENATVANFFCRNAGLVHVEPPGTSIDLISDTKAP